MQTPFQLTQMILKDNLETILEAFTQATGVASIITAVDGRPITAPCNFTRLCQNYCRATEKGRTLCHESDSYGGKESARTRKHVIYKCLNAGLLDSAAPIVVRGDHIANVLCGQVLEEPIDPSTARQNAVRIGIEDIDGYLRELQTIPIIRRERFTAIVRLMEVFTQTLSEMAMQKYILNKNSRRYLDKLVNSVTDCILSTDADGVIDMVNDACTRTFGRPRDRLLGRCLEELLADEASVTRYHDRLQQASIDRNRTTVDVFDADRQVLNMQLSLSSIRSTEALETRYVVVLRDVSEEHRAAKMKEDLMGMLTHDLGNPILSMQKATELLDSEVLGSLNSDQKALTCLAKETGHQAYGMVSDFLDTYRHENGRFVLNRFDFDMATLMQESINQVRLFARDKDLTVAIDPTLPELTLNADRNRLKRVCVNLLENAVKHSPHRGIVQVAMRLINGDEPLLEQEALPESQRCTLRAEATYLLVSVSDDGPGIAAENQPLIFDKFFQTHATAANNRSGIGLGLTFCKLAVEAHGGRIWVKTPLREDRVFKRHGCRFSFCIPIA